MVEGARLESVYTGNRIAGSNPACSAIFPSQTPTATRTTPNFRVVSKGFGRAIRTAETGPGPECGL